jgi:KDO2-lipid IV(A) lauroyltransferase
MNRLVAWAFALMLWVMMVLPVWLTYRVVSCVAWLLTPIMMIHGRRAKPTRTSLRRNFKIAYGKDLSEAEIRTLTYRVLRHMGWLLVDFARLPKIGKEEATEGFGEENAKLLRELLAEGNGVLGVGGHVGAFTHMGRLSGQIELPIYTISSPRRNPHLQKVLHARQSGDEKNIDKRGIARLLKDVLSGNNIVGVLVDEEAEFSDIFMPFMGTMATINPLVARLHLITGAPILVGCVRRIGPARYRFEVAGVLRRKKGERSKRKEQQREIMAEINGLVEGIIRKDPTQWLWSSRRWRTRPPGEEPTPDGVPPRSLPPILPAFIAEARAAKAGKHVDAST